MKDNYDMSIENIRYKARIDAEKRIQLISKLLIDYGKQIKKECMK